jgi:hypothetical protein
MREYYDRQVISRDRGRYSQLDIKTSVGRGENYGTDRHDCHGLVDGDLGGSANESVVAEMHLEGRELLMPMV